MSEESNDHPDDKTTVIIRFRAQEKFALPDPEETEAPKRKPGLIGKLCRWLGSLIWDTVVEGIPYYRNKFKKERLETKNLELQNEKLRRELGEAKGQLTGMQAREAYSRAEEIEIEVSSKGVEEAMQELANYLGTLEQKGLKLLSASEVPSKDELQQLMDSGEGESSD